MATASVLTSLATEAVKAVTMAVTARATEEIRLFSGFKDQLEKLKNRFLYIQALLEDLGNKNDVEKNKLVSLWLEEIKGVAFSAENVMDDYAFEMLRRKIELNINNKPSFKRKCRKFITPSINPIFFRCRMSHRVSEILSKFDELDKKATAQLGLKPVEIAALKERASANSGDDTHHTENKYDVGKGSNIIGRRPDEEKLLPMLLNYDSVNDGIDGLPTIAITGFGGFGKTTLARWLYEHEKVDKHFDKKKIWICVSGNINVQRLLKEMVESLTLARCNLANTDAIIKSLQEKLNTKKFLLVLDDVWDDNKRSWDSLKNALQSIGALPGSVVLMTTRNIDIAKKAGAFYSHQVQGLSEVDGWDLLKQNLFDETFPCVSSLENIGRSIVNKCKGVPLSIIVIRGLLKSKRHLLDWEAVERSHLWDFQQQDILPSLLLSYNHLGSASVKQCFAYCAIFPQDSLMQKGQLISLWLAQDLLYHDDSETSSSSCTMEEIGEKYFNSLVNHSLLQEERNGKRTGYKMHDLVHNLAAYISRKDLLVWKGGDKQEEALNIRHLIFNFDHRETEAEIKYHMSKLRTISFWNTTVCRWKWNSLKSARYIRTLVMANIGLLEVPPVIGQLIHLRYLDLSYNRFEALPDSICNLYQMQTLRLLASICFLRELPSELHKLENVRHIETTRHLLASSGLQKLTNLQTLPRLELRDGEGWTIDELGPLDQVKGDIHITGLEHVKNKEEARKAYLGRKKGILGLSMSWGPDSAREECNDEDVLDSLEPHSNIKSLYVGGFNGVKFPSWMMTMVVNHGGNPTPLSNLIELALDGCRKCQQLPTLGQLPFLKILRLSSFDNVQSIGEEFYQSSISNNDINATELHLTVTAREKVSFRALNELVIGNFPRLTTWMPPSPPLAGIAAFPALKTLKIRTCPQLETVPTTHFQSLQCLELEDVGGTQPMDIVKYSHGLKVTRINTRMAILPQELLNCTSLIKLELRNCTGYKQPPTLGNVPNLMILKLEHFDDLECIGEDFYQSSNKNFNATEELHVTGKNILFRALSKLHISYCKRLTTWMPPSPTVAANVFPILESLTLESCPCLETVPALHFQSLKHLALYEVNGSSQPLDIIKYSHGLISLEVYVLEKMVALPQEISNCGKLQELEISNCHNLKSIPSGLISLKKLKVWHCSSLACIPDGVFQGMSSLSHLDIFDCEGLERMSTSLGECTSLKFLYIQDCPLIKGSIPDLSRLQSLKELELAKSGEWETCWQQCITGLKCLWRLSISGFRDDWNFMSTSLRSLEIRSFNELERLPERISDLSSLEQLKLHHCENLKYLPSKKAMQRLSRLRYIGIWSCPLLEERFAKDRCYNNGPEWIKISHIPSISIGYRRVQR